MAMYVQAFLLLTMVTEEIQPLKGKLKASSPSPQIIYTTAKMFPILYTFHYAAESMGCLVNGLVWHRKIPSKMGFSKKIYYTILSWSIIIKAPAAPTLRLEQARPILFSNGMKLCNANSKNCRFHRIMTYPWYWLIWRSSLLIIVTLFVWCHHCIQALKVMENFTSIF